jgi:hypothetical protein
MNQELFLQNQKNYNDTMNQQFYESYNNKIDIILKKKDLISGIHKIDQNKAELWINSQLTERRRKAARNLIENTHYITFNEVFEDIRNCILQIYKDLNLTKDIYIYIGSNNKTSFYFFAIIAIYFIKLLNYKEPIATNNLKYHCQIIIIDDASYTGGQFGVILMNDLSNTIGINNFACSNIFYGLSVISEYGLKNIDEYKQYFNINIYAQKILKSLKILGKQEFLDLTYYFSPYLYGKTQISLYFDHKIADPVSTFMKVLQFGPILPKYLNYDYILLKDSLVIDEVYGLLTESEFHNYYLKIMEEEQSIKDNITEISYIQFIQNCGSNTIYLGLSYNVLNLTSAHLTLNKTKTYTHRERYIITLLNDSTKRCLQSFYKNLF